MKISVIIVSYNTEKLLQECLGSLFRQTKNLEMEVIVVDNASSDDSQAMVKKRFPQVTLLTNKKNLGFAAGNNVGLKRATGDYILLLNSDTKLVENSLGLMVDFMEDRPKVGLASCQLVDGDGKIQPSGGFFPSLARVFAWMVFLDDLPFLEKIIRPFHPHSPHFYTRTSHYKKEQLHDWITGAFFLMRRKVVEEVGLLDENFFMYVEEMEYCYRAKQCGWQVVYVPLTKIIHFGGQSGSSKGAILGEYQGLKYFFAKHKSSWERFLLRMLLKTGAILRVLFFGIIKGNSKAKEAYVEAFRIT